MTFSQKIAQPVKETQKPTHCPACGCKMLQDAEHGWSCPTCTGADA